MYVTPLGQLRPRNQLIEIPLPSLASLPPEGSLFQHSFRQTSGSRYRQTQQDNVANTSLAAR